MSFNEVEALIEGVDETKQRRWKVALYEVLPKEAISIDVTKDMINFINDQLGSDDVQIPNIYASLYVTIVDSERQKFLW